MYDVLEIALNLIDFCGGEMPTPQDLEKFLRVRGIELEPGIRKRVLIKVVQLLTMP